MQKNILGFLFFFVTTSILSAQQHPLIKDFKKQFEGTWQKRSRYYTNTLKIHFESAADDATITDIGTGEAPPVQLRAARKGNLLVIKPFKEHNDYCELEIQNGKLIFRTQPTIWNEDGTAQPPRADGFFGKTIFKKIKGNTATQ